MSSEKHVAVLAFPFGSHPWPLANLLLKLATAASDVRFSFLNTAKSNGVIFPLPSRAELPSNVRIYDVSDGLQDDCQGATKHPREHVDLFLKAAPESFGAAVDVAEQDVRKKVSCLLTDAFLIFAGEMAEKMQVPWVTLWVPAPYSLAAHVYTDVIRELLRESSGGGTSTDDDDDKSLGVIPGLSMMRISDLPNEIIDDQDTSRVACLLREMGRVLPGGATAVVMNSYVEVNPTPLIADLKSKFKMLLQVGCLTVSFPPPPLPSSSSSDTTGCLTWLDARDPRSVAYICFGTVAMPSPSEVSALGEALESTKTPFLWSIKEHMMAYLPKGLQERTRAYGKFVPWAPQGQVLSHPACGVYVTHCGYNSVFESVAGGVPMVCKPFWADNMMNGRMIEEVWGIGVKVEGGTITKSGMEKALEVVLRGEDGKEMRKKVGELRERLVEAAGPNGSAEADFKVLVELISTS
ncbi:anthocyanidin 3-O-glucosyltransferase 7-like [Eucalyptus grandis]|uniref:anthocyanidin 3-O-glucosyltransferase 7-like n=1 Tax=Eucalyptus grandis TaxID=71139 RepID=UPI00192EFE0E|nr:anthocyanidin 3-O-glucosyltransferase 7-like [Eucalyptus grandis]